MQAYLNTMVGNTAVEIYNKLVYNYTGPTPWNLAERRLPMWGDQSRYRCPSCRTKLRVQTV